MAKLIDFAKAKQAREPLKSRGNKGRNVRPSHFSHLDHKDQVLRVRALIEKISALTEILGIKLSQNSHK